MQKLYLRSLLLVVLSLMGASSVLAWDDTGHKVSAYIAWRQMTLEVRAKAVKLLLAAPEDSHLSVYYPAGSRSAAAKELELFMIASTWADIIRDRDFKIRFEKYNQGPWHYADIFWKQANGKAEMLENRSEGLAITKLYDFEKNLKDELLSDAEKAVNLAWFLHVAGDVHNPVHNASRVTEIEPKGDSGANLFLLSPAGAPENRVNLHSYWDSILRRNVPRENDACDSDYIASTANKIMKKHSFSEMKERLKLGDYRQWNAEGFGFLNKTVYDESLKRGELPAKKYQNRAFAVGREQIALAGYRMAETLNRIFGKS
ncbi:MAG TPA: S1/P1 nuclease [Pyrinomonadaceae bacterium]|nr:S1/P1 nuclease [Pyrinomonadaceae bacterium]